MDIIFTCISGVLCVYVLNTSRTFWCGVSRVLVLGAVPVDVYWKLEWRGEVVDPIGGVQ